MTVSDDAHRISDGGDDDYGDKCVKMDESDASVMTTVMVMKKVMVMMST